MIFTLKELKEHPQTNIVRGGITVNTAGLAEWHLAKPLAWNGMRLKNRIKAAWLVLCNKAIAVRWY